eukprot:scaffold290190_cov18-Tisochrysis_lutea.AAC.1
MPLEARAKIVSPLCPPSQQSGSTICALQDLTWAAKGAALQLRWRGVQGMDIKEGSRCKAGHSLCKCMHGSHDAPAAADMHHSFCRTYLEAVGAAGHTKGGTITRASQGAL